MTERGSFLAALPSPAGDMSGAGKICHIVQNNAELYVRIVHIVLKLLISLEKNWKICYDKIVKLYI